MTNKKTKILFLLGNLGTGGQERQMTELIKALSAKNSYEIYVIIKSIKSIIHRRDKSHYYDEISNSTNHLICLNREHFDFQSLIMLYKNILSINPDIIHNWSKITTSVSIFTKIFSFKKFKIIDGSIRNTSPLSAYGKLYKLEKKIHFIFSDKIVANTYAGLKVNNVPKIKGLCIYNGFAFQRINNLKNKEIIFKELKIKTPFIVGMVANFDERKDNLTYLNTAYSVLKERDDITFIAVGEGINLKYYMNKFKHKNIIFTGKRSDVESIINTFTIGVLLSNYKIHGEGISNSILEYMSLKKPVIATYGNGTNEIVLNNKTGYLIKHNNSNALKEKILYLIDNKLVVKEMGIKGFSVLSEKFNYSTMVQKYISLYNNLTS